LNIKKENYRSSKLVNESYVYILDEYESMICYNIVDKKRCLDKFIRRDKRGLGYFDFLWFRQCKHDHKLCRIHINLNW